MWLRFAIRLLLSLFIAHRIVNAGTLEIANLSTGLSTSYEIVSGSRISINFQYQIGDNLRLNWYRPSYTNLDALVGTVIPSMSSTISSTYQQYPIFSISDTTSLSINGNEKTNISFNYPSNYYADGTYTYQFAVDTLSALNVDIVSNYSRIENKRLGTYYPGTLVPGTGMGGSSPPAQFTGAYYEVMQLTTSGSETLLVNLIPEPSALSLLAVGLGGLAMIRRRRS